MLEAASEASRAYIESGLIVRAQLNQIREWFGQKVYDDIVHRAGGEVAIYVDPISRRLKWWAKLAFPKIDTHRTRFQFVPERRWMMPLEVPTTLESNSIWREEIIDLREWRGTGHLTRVACRFWVGYSEALDLCLIYNDPESKSKRLFIAIPLIGYVDDFKLMPD